METPGGAVGKTKDQGLYNKPSAAVNPRALAAWTLPTTIQYNTITTRHHMTERERKYSTTQLRKSENS